LYTGAGRLHRSRKEGSTIGAFAISILKALADVDNGVLSEGFAPKGVSSRGVDALVAMVLYKGQKCDGIHDALIVTMDAIWPLTAFFELIRAFVFGD
jgi:hypothetical protein